MHTCGLKVDTNDPEWYKSLSKVLRKIKGASYTINAEEGMVYITGAPEEVEIRQICRHLQGQNWRPHHVRHQYRSRNYDGTTTTCTLQLAQPSSSSSSSSLSSYASLLSAAKTVHHLPLQ
ncbi:hypothetical protein LWI28_005296 [Acer negundo]|uniref:HMA domain-containing protein n=1 Tax=Acer negundo TaxID=4023 RepID=A0AAD5NVV3_ACENE|nr:hypothetical protein LWI28_005296 [Acer negundo]